MITLKNKEKRKKTSSKKKLDIDLEITQEIDIVDALPDVISDDIEQSTKVKRKIKRTKNTSPQRLYFHSGTQDAIVAYQKSTSAKERETLYVNEIVPAFQKLVENLINIHKFGGLHDSYDDLKNDCVNFLFETILKFDSTRGTNAFSYFNVVAKNWLIIKTKQRSLSAKRTISMDDPDVSSVVEQLSETHGTDYLQDTQLDKRLIAESIVKTLYEVRNYVKSENELLCINSIITIFETIDKVDMLNKKAVLLYIREISGLSPKQLTTTLQALKKYYRKTKSDSADFFLSM